MTKISVEYILTKFFYCSFTGQQLQGVDFWVGEVSDPCPCPPSIVGNWDHDVPIYVIDEEKYFRDFIPKYELIKSLTREDFIFPLAS